jgi:transcriptional regulator with XRE-family HTH domain
VDSHPTAAGPTVVDMDNRADVREFLMSRRAKVTPAAAGIVGATNRRVPGLRRSEVADLAGVSVEYYAKLERGAIGGASASVLDSVAGALQLDDTERAHLFDLARAADGIPSSGLSRRRGTRPTRSSRASRPDPSEPRGSTPRSERPVHDQAPTVGARASKRVRR